MSGDSAAPHAEASGAPVLAGDAAGSSTSLRLSGGLSVATAFAWTAFFLYVETGFAAWLDRRYADDLSGLTGLAISLVPGRADIVLIHLLCAVALATLALPLFGSRRRAVVPVYDWLLVVIAAAAAVYLGLYRQDIAAATGLSPGADLAVAVTALLVLGATVYRVLGGAMLAVTAGLVAAALIGVSAAAPQVNLDASARPLDQFWLGTEGAFGRPLEIAVTLIFPFVLFGTLWLQAGAATYFARVAASCFGGRDGGAGKAAVAGSLLSGCYAPSSRVNTRRCLPAAARLMHHSGVSDHRARTVQRASSSHAQLVPPVMAVAAFLIADRTGLSIAQIALHAALPAAIAYIALYLFVHFDAERTHVGGLPVQPVVPNRARNVLHLVLWCIATCALAVAAAVALAWVRRTVPQALFPLSVGAWFLVYAGLLWSASRRPDIAQLEQVGPGAELPPLGAALASGLYLLLPLFFLVLQVAGAERPAAQSMLLCAALAAAIVVTHHPIKALFRGQYDYLRAAIARGLRELCDGLVQATRIMAPVVVASAAAGVLLSAATLTGLDHWFMVSIEQLAAGHAVFGLVLAAGAVLLLSIGLPTALGYIVSAMLVAPAIAGSGFAPPAVAIHLFILYICVLASDLPPMKATAPLIAVPFLFAVNPELLLIGVEPARVPVVATTAVLGAVAMAGAVNRHLLMPSRLWETFVLALAAISLLCPGIWIGGPLADLVYIPALMLLGTVWLLQLRRRNKIAHSLAAA